MAKDEEAPDVQEEDSQEQSIPILSLILFAVFVAVLVSVLVLGVALAASGAGLLLGHVFGMNPVHGAWIVLGAMVVVALLIGLLTIRSSIDRVRTEGVPVRLETDEEDDIPEELMLRLLRKLQPDSGRRSWGSFRRARRAPCPCGSGRKFADCCGEKATE
jgi:hypothetical protein